jgi:mevalonate kinase
MTAISRSAPGKLILCGEHAVVYHQPAIAVPVMQVCTTTKVLATPTAPRGTVRVIAPQLGLESSLDSLPESDPLCLSIKMIQAHFNLDHLPACEIRINSSIPVASGLGSSASVSVSLVRALSEFLGCDLDDTETNQLAYEMEKLHHGNPSGIDNTVITFARPVCFMRGEPMELLQIAAPIELIIANTGIQASTAEAVEMVKKNHEENPQKYDAHFSEIGSLTQLVKEHLSEGFVEAIGPLLTQNHHLLQQLGVSCPELDNLVAVALAAGALGAKLSGGGLGGNMLALVNTVSADNVETALQLAGAISTIRTVVQPSQRVSQ